MKKIQPLNIWSNGLTKVAKYLTLVCGSDNLTNAAFFYYALFAETENQEGEKIQGEKLADGNLTMDGEDYINWDNNNYAWNWAATKLNIQLDETQNSEEIVVQVGKKFNNN